MRESGCCFLGKDLIGEFGDGAFVVMFARGQAEQAAGGFDALKFPCGEGDFQPT